MQIKRLTWRIKSLASGKYIFRVPFMAILIALLVTTGLSIFLQIRQTASAAPVPTVNANTKHYDPIVLPISDAEVQAGLVRGSRDAQAEYALLLRAGYQHREKAAYETMNRLRHEQPNNPIVLACYFMAFRMAEGGNNSIRYNGGYQAINFTHWEDEEAEAQLSKAYALAPELWLTYAVDGTDKLYVPDGNREQALALLKKAEELAPDIPYTHWLLGNAYLTTPISQHKYMMAAVESRKALATGAPLSASAFILFQIYSLWMPNPVEEVKWKRKYLSLVPPNVKMNPDAKQWLDRYPG